MRATLAKRELPGATWPALAGTLAAEASFESAFGAVLMVAAVWLGVGVLHGPSPVLLIGAALALLAVAALALRSRRVRRLAGEVGRGLAVLRTPGRCARQVLPWQVLSRTLRIGSATCFLLAFGLPVAPAVVVAACAALGSGSAMPLPGAGPAAIGAALLVAIPLAAGHAVDHGDVASMAIVWPTALTAVGITLSLTLLAVLCGARTPRALVRAARSLRPQPAPLVPVTAALGWGALAASSLVIGAAAGLARPWPTALVGLVLAFGAGALISAVSFDLAEEGAKIGGGGVGRRSASRSAR